jgi:hypothetical protein
MRTPKVLKTAAAGLLLSVVAACGTGHDGIAASSRLHGLPTSSWQPGDRSLLALARGVLEGGYVGGTFCVWLTTMGGQSPIVWPAGYHVRLHPLALLNPQDVVVASGGDRIAVGGGEVPVNPGRTCMLRRQFAFYVMSKVTVLHK